MKPASTILRHPKSGVNRPNAGSIRHFSAGIALMAAFGMTVHSASAVVLLTDNFTAPSNPNTNNVNYNLAGRQGGTLATIAYTTSGNTQVGNNTGGIDGGNYLISAFNGSSSLNRNFATDANASGGQLIVSFSLAPNVGAAASNVWGAFNIGDLQNQGVNAGTTDFGILFRGNGEIQAFQDGGVLLAGGVYWDGGTGVSNHTTDLNPITLVISSPSGTGSVLRSGFTGSGTQIQVFNGAILRTTLTLSSALTASEGFMTFQGNNIAGFDNLSILVTPEPSTLALLGLGSLGLLVRRRTCRKA